MRESHMTKQKSIEPRRPAALFNIAMARGVLINDPRMTELPSGSVVWNYDLATTGHNGTKCSVPVAWIDPSRPQSMKAGDDVLVLGSIRRRFFRLSGLTQSRTELLAEVVAKSGTARATKALSSYTQRLRGA